MDEYKVLKRGGLFNLSKRRIVLLFVAMGIGLVMAVVGNLLDEPKVTYYVSEDGTYELKSMNDTKYTINDVELTQDFGKSNNGLSVYTIVGSIGMLVIMASIVFRVSAKPSLGFYFWGWLNKFGKNNKVKEEQVLNFKIPNDVQGVIGVRCWSYNDKGKLTSKAAGSVWESSRVKSDIEPHKDNNAGVYAYLLGSLNGYNNLNRSKEIVGVVEILGRCIGHEDSIIRGTKAKILLILSNNKKTINKIKNNYDCEIIYAKNPVELLNNWAITSEGSKWLQHNTTLIDQNKITKLDKDILDISAYKSFEGEPK
jgi:hypothetical protein